MKASSPDSRAPAVTLERILGDLEVAHAKVEPQRQNLIAVIMANRNNLNSQEVIDAYQVYKSALNAHEAKLNELVDGVVPRPPR